MSFGFGFGLPSQLYLIGSPTLNLNLAGATVLDPIVTFTRASSASYYNSLGLLSTASTNTPRFDYNPATLAAQGLLIEEQRTNLLTYSSEFDNAAWIKNNATVSANSIASPDGNVDADKLVESTATGLHSIQQAITVASGTTYTFTVYAKVGERQKLYLIGSAAGFTANQAIYDVSTGVVSSVVACTATMSSVGNGWYRCVWTATATANASTTFNIFLDNGTTNTYTGDGTSGLYIYGAQLEAGAFPTSYIPSTNTFTSRASTGSYIDATGTLQSAAINVARNTYNPANLLAQPFLLLEEARTNSIRNNTMVGAVAGTPGTVPTNWTVTTGGVTRTIVGTGTEGGITYIDVRLQAASAISTFVLFDATNQIAASNGQTWTASTYIKLISGSLTNLDVSSRLTMYSSAPALLGNFAVTVTPTAANLATQRYINTATLNNASVATIDSEIWLIATGAYDITLRIGLPQLEQGTGATSVIPTTTTALTRSADVSSSAQATRAADLAPINTLSPWYNASEGTLVVETLRSFVPSAATYPAAAEFDNGTLTRWGVYATPQASVTEYRAFVQDAGVGQADIGGVASRIAINTVVKQAFAAKLNDFALSVNGSAVFTDTAGIFPSTVNRMSIGSSYVAANFFNGYIRRITYYPRRLSNTELQTLTT